MKLKIKKLFWYAGRPVVVLSPSLAKKLNVSVNERVCISFKKRKVYAIVDIFSDIVSDCEIGISREVLNFVPLREKTKVEVYPAESSIVGQLIKKKMEGQKLNENEIRMIVEGISQNSLTETEIAFFISAEKIVGMEKKEIINLVEAMVKTGNRLNLNKKIVADKHCIGGIAGNRTTPIVVSICACAGLTIPKTSSRAITSAAGTADTIETIARVDLKKEEILEVIKKTNACLAWNGSLNLSPSDDKIIHIERILNLDVEPQLIASILSKKIAAGSTHVLIDIPYGSGKILTLNEAKSLGKKFIEIGKHFNLKIRTVYTDGRIPIGNGIGPLLEIRDVLSVLQGDGPYDLKEKSIYLAGELMDLCGIKNSYYLARQILESGKAYEKFKEIINEQNKKKDFEERIRKLKDAKISRDLLAEKSGIIKSIDNKKINLLCRILGAPETKTAGVYLHKKFGKVEKGEKIITLYSESEMKLKDALRYFEEFEPIVIR
ncbi:MAG: thymidine phosphorylase [Candidatus Pacearchaeota archaeon]